MADVALLSLCLDISVRACLFKAGLNPSLIALAARPLAALLGNFRYAEAVEQIGVGRQTGSVY
jgi:hypothetical protein